MDDNGCGSWLVAAFHAIILVAFLIFSLLFSILGVPSIILAAIIALVCWVAGVYQRFSGYYIDRFSTTRYTQLTAYWEVLVPALMGAAFGSFLGMPIFFGIYNASLVLAYIVYGLVVAVLCVVGIWVDAKVTARSNAF